MKRISIGHTGIIMLLLAVSVFSSGCVKNITAKYLIYENDFESDSTRGLLPYNATGVISPPPIMSFNGSKVFGPFNNNTIQISFFNLPSHNAMQVEFDLNIHDNWDGDFIGPTGVPDIFQMKADQDILLITTFSNNSNLQSYPNYFKSVNSVPLPARTNAARVDLPGVCSLRNVAGGTTTYRISKFFLHSLSNMTFSCNDALQPYNSLCQKSWSVDNFTITAIRY